MNKIPDKRFLLILMILLFSTIVLFFLNLMMGSISLFSLENNHLAYQILYFHRLPEALVAFFCGSALSLAALLLQCLFRNPLAESSLLGISSGAGLGMALITLGGLNGKVFYLFSSLSAPLGAGLIIFFLLLFSFKNPNSTFFLLFGIAISSLCNAFITLLIHFAPPDSVKSFLNWSFGSFANLTPKEIPLLIFTLATPSLLSFLLPPSLNQLQLGETYAKSMGLNLKAVQLFALSLVCMISAFSTLFCGPIAFVGIAAPHFSRRMLKSSDHRKLFPVAALLGADLALLADLLSRTIGKTPLPINALLALVGVPALLSVFLSFPKAPKRAIAPKATLLDKPLSISQPFPPPFLEPKILLKSEDPLSLGYHPEKPICSMDSFTLPSGKLIALVGANGCGKSTLLKSLVGLIAPLSGKIVSEEGIALHLLSPQKRAKKMALILSDRENTEWLTVEEVVALGLYGEGRFLKAFQIRLNQTDQEKIETALGWTHLLHKQKELAIHLSDGEFRRLMIARAIVQNSPLLLADEPLAFLDEENRTQILNLFRFLTKENRSILFSTHQPLNELEGVDRIIQFDSAQNQFIVSKEKEEAT